MIILVIWKKVFTFTLATLSTAGIALLAAGLGFLIAKLYELATGTKAADAEMKQLGVDVQENTEFLKDQLGINQRFQQENIARMKAGNAAESDLRKQNLKDAKDNLNQINEILSTHMPQFKKSNVLKCYDILLKKYLDDNRPSKIQ